MQGSKSGVTSMLQDNPYTKQSPISPTISARHVSTDVNPPNDYLGKVSSHLSVAIETLTRIIHQRTEYLPNEIDAQNSETKSGPTYLE